MRRYMWLLTGLALIAVMFSAALAKDDSPGKGQRGRQERRGGPPIVFGEITALSENGITIKPEIPERMKERMAERRKENGREMPKLPDSITIKLGPDTKWYFNGADGSRKDFAVGDKVVVKLLRSKDEKEPTAETVADPETAKQYIMEKMRERRGPGGPGGEQGGWQGRDGGQGGPDGGWGQGRPGGAGYGPGPGGGQGFEPGPGGPGGPGFGPGPDGDQGYGPGPGGPDGPGFGPSGPGGPDGPSGPGGQRMGPGGRGGRHPAFGAVISVNRDSVTIRPDVPDFVAKMMQDHNIPKPNNLPDTLTLPIDEFTVFINNGEKVNKNPFAKGERVMIIMGRDDSDQPIARAIIDLQTAKAKMEKMMQNRDDRGDRGRGPGKGKGPAERRNKDENRDSGRRNPR